MPVAVRGAELPVRDRAVTARQFFALLAVATAGPLLLLPFHSMETPSAWNGAILLAWLLAGYGHVMSTLWFGVDRAYHPVIGAHRGRMLAGLAIIQLMFGAVAVTSLIAASWVYVGYTAWLAHHYNRQNYGLVAFASAHDDMGPMPREIGWFFNLTSAAGAIGMIAMPSIFPCGRADRRCRRRASRSRRGSRWCSARSPSP